MSVWEQRRKEREASKPQAPAQKVTKFQAPKQASVQPKIVAQPAQVNVVKSSTVKTLTQQKQLEEEYGGAVQLEQPQMMDFQEFHRQGGMAAILQQDYASPPQQQQQWQEQQQQNSPQRGQYQQQYEQQYQRPPGSRADAEMEKYQKSAKTFEIGQPRQQYAQYDRNATQQQPTQPAVPLARSKKPSEMTEAEYQEYERQRQEKSMLLLIKKVLYDKSVSTFDQNECQELRKMDKNFAAMFEAEQARKQMADSEASRRSEEARGQQAQQQVQQQKPQHQQNQGGYQRGNGIQGVSQSDLYEEINSLARENKALQEKLHSAEYQLGDYEKQIGVLQSQITDERQQRIQANKNFEQTQRDMELLKQELLAFKQKYEELKQVQEQQEKLDAAVRLADQTYKPSSPGKPSMVDQLMMNCNQVLEKYSHLEDTMRHSIASQQQTFCRNNTGTIKVDDESPIRGFAVKQQSVKDSLRAMNNENYVPSCLTDELDGEAQLTSMLPKSRFSSRPASQQ